MQLDLKKKLVVGGVALLAAYAFGRFSAPEKVKVETKVVEVEKKTDQTDKDRNKHKETVTTEIVKPDGSKETTTKTVEDSNTKTSTKDVVTTDKSTDNLKEVTRSGSKVTIDAIAAIQGSNLTSGPAYGLSVSSPVLGPITVQVFGLSNLTFGAGVGLTF